MEDVKGVRDSIVIALEDHDWSIKKIWGAPSALKLAAEGVTYFLLDIDMGSRGEQLGLDVLQKLLAFNPDICVVILSSHTQEYRRRALSAGAEFVLAKTRDIDNDVREVLRHFYQHLGRMAQMRFDSLGSAGATGVTAAGEGPIISDPNEAEFLRLSTDPAWVREHSGQYAAFVESRCVAFFDDREACVDALITRYANRSRFLARVGRPVLEFDLPSVLEVEFY